MQYIHVVNGDVAGNTCARRWPKRPRAACGSRSSWWCMPTSPAWICRAREMAAPLPVCIPIAKGAIGSPCGLVSRSLWIRAAAPSPTNRLPTFALIVPNMCHDTHDCSVSTGDAWLGTWLPRILSSSAYQAGRTAVFITWDEDDESHGNQVMLLEVAPSVPPGWTLTGRVTHLNLLRTTEDMLGLAALVPSAASMRSAGRL